MNQTDKPIVRLHLFLLLLMLWSMAPPSTTIKSLRKYISCLVTDIQEGLNYKACIYIR